MRAARCGRLIYDVDEPPIDDALIVMDGPRVSWVGPFAQRPSELPIEVLLDLSGYSVLPGFVDSHAHLSADMARPSSLADQHGLDLVTATIRGVRNLETDFNGGVTTMRTLGGPDKVEARFRDALGSGELLGPQLKIAIRMLRPTHGTANFVGVTADGVEGLRQKIRETFYFGADWLKLFATNVMRGESHVDYLRGDLTGVPAYSAAELQFAIGEAHDLGIPVAAHALGGPAVGWAIEAGVDSIEHGDLIEESQIELFVRHGTYLSDPNLMLMFDPDEIRTVRSFGLPQEPWWQEKTTQTAANLRRIIPKFLEAGVKICLGVDSNHGLLWREVGHLSDLGAKPTQALRAITKNGAELLRMTDEVGTLQPGRYADLVAVPEDPLRNPWSLEHARLVVHRGEPLRAALGALPVPVAAG
jgi:imidazolonepropionase-like amidohydrolase